jgi:hypothetical protein
VAHGEIVDEAVDLVGRQARLDDLLDRVEAFGQPPARASPRNRSGP